MDSDLEQLVNATRRLGRSRPNRRVSGTVNRRRRGEKLLRTIRQSGGIPQPKIIEPRQLHEKPKADAMPEDTQATVFSDIAGFARKFGDAVMSVGKRKQANNRVFTPFPGASCELIHRSAKRRRTTTEPAYQEPPINDRESKGLAVAGVALIALAFIGVAATVSSNANRTGSGAPSPMAVADASPENEPAPEASERDADRSEIVLTGSGEPE